ncbi:DNA-binding protein WhiA [bacterium]|nr:MAG: DNA-binding protein WhiA [bacterium]
MRSTLSADVKDALAREVPQRPCCLQTLLHGLAYYGAPAGTFRTQRPAVARLFHALLARGRTGPTPITTHSSKRLYHATVYAAEVPAQLRAHTAAPLTRRCCRRMELRAAFLTCGSLALPGKGYHLEFTPPSEAAAARIERLLAAEGIAPKRGRRRGGALLYVKEADGVVGVLGAIGAHGAVLRIEEIRAVKETKNRIHRLVNVEAANVVRAVAAASRQRRAIELLRDAYGLQHLTPALREAAEARLRHPELTLGELAALCRPPVSRATLNGRLQSLLRLAHRLQAEQASPEGTR